METEEIQIAYYTMNELMDMLEDHGFFLCYQSYIISLNRLEWIGDEGHQMYYVKLRGRKEKIPVSRNYYGTLRQLLQNKLANEAKSSILLHDIAFSNKSLSFIFTKILNCLNIGQSN
jgi:hypothetical protein